jgi:hypothetical protein
MWLADGKRAHVFDVPYFAAAALEGQPVSADGGVVLGATGARARMRGRRTLDFFEDWDLAPVAQHTDFLRVPGITAVYRANLSASGVTGEGSPSADPRISRDRERVAQRLAALRDRYQRRVDELKAEARSARSVGDTDRALAAWREAGRIDPTTSTSCCARPGRVRRRCWAEEAPGDCEALPACRRADAAAKLAIVDRATAGGERRGERGRRR